MIDVVGCSMKRWRRRRDLKQNQRGVSELAAVSVVQGGKGARASAERDGQLSPPPLSPPTLPPPPLSPSRQQYSYAQYRPSPPPYGPGMGAAVYGNEDGSRWSGSGAVLVLPPPLPPAATPAPAPTEDHPHSPYAGRSSNPYML